MGKQIGRAWHLDEVSSGIVQNAKKKGYVVKHYVLSAIQKAMKEGLKPDVPFRPNGDIKFITLDEATFYKMQAMAAKEGISDSEYVRRSIRQYGK